MLKGSVSVWNKCEIQKKSPFREMKVYFILAHTLFAGGAFLSSFYVYFTWDQWLVALMAP